jgi:hypothetical protein
LMAQRTIQPGFANTCRAGDEDVVTLPHPLVCGEAGDEGLIQSPWMPIVEIFEAGGLAQLGLAQARGQPPVFPLRALAVDQELEALLEGEGRDVGHLELLDEGLIHTSESQGLQFVEGGMCEHEGSPLSSFV